MIPRKHVQRLVVTAACLALSVLPMVARAQAAANVIINYPEVSEGANSVSLGMYFTVFDGNGQIISEPAIASAEIVLNDEQTATASVAQPTSDAYIVLVLDASGSMASAMQQMRQAAIQAVENAPDDAVFAVLQFNNNIELIQDFTQDRRQVAEKIDGIRAVANAGTCLYDATYRALEILDDAPLGRRGVILFTDGKDETAEGTVCSTHTYDEVVELATRQSSRVPIHTIGLATGNENSINEEELGGLASETGGFSETGEINSLALLFQRIINGLSSQWLARADVYPHRGENSAQLILHMDDGSEIQADSLSFTASRDYVAPPTATVNSISYAKQGNVIFDLTLTNADQLDHFLLQVVDVQDNIPAPAFTADATEELEVGASNFESGNEYRLEITGQDEANNDLFEASYEFRYNPTIVAGELRVTSVQVDADAPHFVADVSATNIEGVSTYEVWLVDQNTNTVVPGSRRKTEADSSIVVPLDDVPNGTYTIMINALDATGTVLAETSYEDAVYRKGLVSRLGSSLRAAPYILGGLGLVMAIAFAFLIKVAVIDPRRERPDPVLLQNTMSRRADELNDVLDDWRDDAARLQKLRKGGRRSATPPPAAAPRPAAPSAKPPLDEATVLAEPPPGGQPTAVLTIEKAPGEFPRGKQYTITHTPFTIGRKDCDLNIGIPNVSRLHAQIDYHNGRYVIRDDGSTNGTYINETPVTGKGDVPLSPGVHISLGNDVTLRLDILAG
jgi:hypothetical protein